MSLMKVSTILMMISLVQVEGSPALLERLLQSNLKTAACQARCAGVSSEELESCLQICGLTESSLGKICQHERFCTGGCRATCNSDREKESKLRSVSQQDCLLTWSVTQQSHHSSLVYLVAGLDQAGMFSLLADQVVETSLELSPALTERFSQLSVLVVDRRGLTDTKTISLQSVSHCQNSQTEAQAATITVTELSRQDQEDEVTVEKLENKSYQAALYSIAAMVVISMLILIIFTVAFALYMMKRDRRSIEKVKSFTTRNAFIKCQEDVLYDKQYNNEIYTFF